MKPIALITGLLYGVLAVFVVIYHQGYTTFFDKFDLPGALSHTLYRVILLLYCGKYPFYHFGHLSSAGECET